MEQLEKLNESILDENGTIRETNESILDENGTIRETKRKHIRWNN